MVTGAAADSSEVRSAKQELERLLSLQLSPQPAEAEVELESRTPSLGVGLDENADVKQSDPRPSADSEGKT